MSGYLDFDKKLYHDLRGGKEYAFLTVFDQYNRLIYTIAFRFLKSAEDAEDAVQFVFMRLWEKRESFVYDSGIRSLLFTILKNYIMNELRHRNVIIEKHYKLSQQGEMQADDFLTLYESQELKRCLHLAIDRLPAQKKKICLFKIEEGLSNQEIADALGLSVATVKSHYTQAIKMIRAELESIMVLFPLLWIHFING